MKSMPVLWSNIIWVTCNSSTIDPRWVLLHITLIIIAQTAWIPRSQLISVASDSVFLYFDHSHVIALSINKLMYIDIMIIGIFRLRHSSYSSNFPKKSSVVESSDAPKDCWVRFWLPWQAEPYAALRSVGGTEIGFHSSLIPRPFWACWCPVLWRHLLLSWSAQSFLGYESPHILATAQEMMPDMCD